MQALHFHLCSPRMNPALAQLLMGFFFYLNISTSFSFRSSISWMKTVPICCWVGASSQLVGIVIPGIVPSTEIGSKKQLCCFIFFTVPIKPFRWWYTSIEAPIVECLLMASSRKSKRLVHLKLGDESPVVYVFISCLAYANMIRLSPITTRFFGIVANLERMSLVGILHIVWRTIRLVRVGFRITSSLVLISRMNVSASSKS